MCAVSALMMAQDAAGQYKLTGVDVEYNYISRPNTVSYESLEEAAANGFATPLTVTDIYGFGITQQISEIPAGAALVPFAQTMQLTNAGLAAIGINLNVTLNADGSGSIAEGSYYPDVNTIQHADGSCETLQQVLPVTDEFTYTSDGSNAESVQPGMNALGLPSISTHQGEPLGGLGLSGSLTFEDYPMDPIHPTLCDESGLCWDYAVDVDGDGNIIPDFYGGNDIYVPGGMALPGYSGGFFLKRGLNTDDLSSVFEGNTTPDFYLEWHGVDGVSSGLGNGETTPAGDDIGDDDGDGTWWDRRLGLPYVTATYLVGWDNPIFGDLTGIYPAEAISAISVASSGYLMDPSGSLATWGNFLTAHGAIFQQCQLFGMDAATCASLAGGILLVDDSGYDVDPTCLSDFTGTNLDALFDCAGRLTMNFNPPCIPIAEAREVVAEFVEVGGGGCGTGNVNGDPEGETNVLDVVALVNCILNENCDNCAGDMNDDGGYNVVDVVNLVNCVLNENCDVGRVNAATSAEFNVIGNEVTITANGIVGGIQMTLSHGKDFSLTLTEDADNFSGYLTEGNTTTLVIINPTGTSLFTANGDFAIESVIASNYKGDSKLSTKVNMLKSYSVSAAYPNPFNPTTQMSLTLNTSADVSVKVFNMTGQVIDVIANGQMDKGTYSLTWDGTNVSSGVYFIKTEVGLEVHNQKIMLVK